MKKKTLIVVIICVLVAAVIGLSAAGIVGSPQGSTPTASFAGWQESCRGIPSMP